MKPFLTALLLSLISTVCFGASAPVELKVERRTLDRDERMRGRKSQEELIRGLHITVKNNTAKPSTAGTVEWEIVVHRGGPKASIISRGSEPLKSLGTAQSAQFTVGAVPVMENGPNRQDMEFRVRVRQGTETAAAFSSTQEFEALAKNARSIDKPEPGEKPRKEKK